MPCLGHDCLETFRASVSCSSLIWGTENVPLPLSFCRCLPSFLSFFYVSGLLEFSLGKLRNNKRETITRMGRHTYLGMMTVLGLDGIMLVAVFLN